MLPEKIICEAYASFPQITTSSVVCGDLWSLLVMGPGEYHLPMVPQWEDQAPLPHLMKGLPGGVFVEPKTPIVGTFAFHPLNGYETYPMFRVDEHPSIASILWRTSINFSYVDVNCRCFFQRLRAPSQVMTRRRSQEWMGSAASQQEALNDLVHWVPSWGWCSKLLAKLVHMTLISLGFMNVYDIYWYIELVNGA